MSRDDNGPKSLGDALRQLTSRYRKVDFFVIDEIRERWVDIVGATLAERCVPELVREGALVIRVPSGAFAERLRSQEVAILEGLRDLGARAPKSLRFEFENGVEKRP